MACAISSFYFFCCAWLTEPGVIPRRKPIKSKFAESLDIACHAKTKQVLSYSGKKTKFVYCRTCNIFRPPRAEHCLVCNNCVERYDHHCPWVGNCIGQRNYRHFYRFIASAFALDIYIVTGSCLKLLAHPDGFGGGLLSEPLTFVLAIVVVLKGAFVGGLCVFHTYLTATNQTTYDNIRQLAPGSYGFGFDLCRDLFYLGEPTKVKPNQPEEIVSSSSDDEEEYESTDEEEESIPAIVVPSGGTQDNSGAGASADEVIVSEKFSLDEVSTQ